MAKRFEDDDNDISPRRLLAQKDKEIKRLTKLVETTRKSRENKVNYKYRWFKAKTAESWKVTQAMLRAHADKHYYDKMKVDTWFRTNYIDGVFQFPLIKAWAYSSEMTDDQVRLIILMSNYAWFGYDDAEIFNMSRSVVKHNITKLVNLGYVQQFEQGMKQSFVLSKKGEEKFKEIQQFIRNGMKVLYAEMDKRHRIKNSGTSSVRIMGNFLEGSKDELAVIDKMTHAYDKIKKEAKEHRNAVKEAKKQQQGD